MQQSLQLLQTPVAELRQMVAAELASNPSRGGISRRWEAESLREEPRQDANASSLQEECGSICLSCSSAQYSSQDEEKRRYLFESLASRPPCGILSLIRLPIAEKERKVVDVIAGNLDQDGYLRISMKNWPWLPGLGIIFEKTLEKVRQFEPAGLRLGSCRLSSAPTCQEGEGNGLAARILRHHLQLLARHRYDEIAKHSGAGKRCGSCGQDDCDTGAKAGRPFADAMNRGRSDLM